MRVGRLWPGQHWTGGSLELNRAGQGWLDLNRAGQGQLELNRAGQGQLELNRAGQGQLELNRAGQVQPVRLEDAKFVPRLCVTAPVYFICQQVCKGLCVVAVSCIDLL